MPGGLAGGRVQTHAGHRPLRRRVRRENLLNLQVGDLGFDLRLELVGGAPELGKKLSSLTSHLRQLLRPKKNEHQEEQENRVGKTHGHRSEEHTSELQSLRHLVCRLLLEKKKH